CSTLKLRRQTAVPARCRRRQLGIAPNQTNLVTSRVAKKLGTLHRHRRPVVGAAIGLRVVQDHVTLRIDVEYGIEGRAATTAATATTCEDFLEADFAFVIS